MHTSIKRSISGLIVLVLYLHCNSQMVTPSTTLGPVSTTPPSPFAGDHGMIMTVMHEYGDPNAAQLRHLEIYLGYENFSGAVPGIGFSNPNIHFLSIDYEFQSKCIYLYDYHLRSIAIGCGYNTALNVSEMTFKFIHVGVSRGTVQVAVDWLTHIVYWSDSVFRWIVGAPADINMVDKDYYKIIVDKHLDAPDGLAVDPQEQLLFWSDNGKHPKIERSTTSGTERRTIVRKDISSPLSMEVDIFEKRIYWIDATYETIATSDYDGRNVYTIKRIPGSNLLDIALFQECVYVTDIRNSDLITVNKTNGPHKGKLESTTVNIFPETIYGIAVYGKEKQPPLNGTDYCALKKCDHMCVLTKTGAKCLCSEGYHLNSTGQCEASYLDYRKALVIANQTHICLVDLRAFAHTNHDVVCRYTSIKPKNAPVTTTSAPSGRKKRQVVNTTPGKVSTLRPNSSTSPVLTTPAPTAAPGDLIVKFDMDMKSRDFYFATADNKIYKRPIDLPIENDAKDFIASATGNISGIAFDAVNGKNLYWCEYDTGHIRVVNVGTKAVVKVDALVMKKPRELMVLLERRRLAMITGETGAMSIVTMDFDGGNMAVVVKEVTDISAFAYDREQRKFYYVSGRNVHSVNLNATNDRVENYRIDSNTFHLVLYKNFLAWAFTAGSYKHLIRTYDLTTRTNNALGYFDNSTLIDMNVLDIDLQTTNLISPCAYENGNCSQICITHYTNDVMTKVCECRLGYSLGPDMTSCRSTVVDDNFILVADWTSEALQQINIQTDGIAAIPGNDNDEYMGVYFDADTKKMVWAEYYDSEIKSSNLNGTGLQVLSDLGYDGYAYRFNKDMTTKNLYFTAYYDTFIGVLTNKGDFIKFDYDFEYDDLGDIVVHPGKGWMYFTVTGWGQAYIGRADMDGNNVVELIKGDHVDFPDGLAIDYLHDHLYWSDATFDTIQQCDLDGANCKTIKNMTSTYRDEQIRDLETDGTYLYYSAYHRDHVVRMDLSPPYDHKKVGENPAVGKLDTIAFYSSTNKNVQPVAKACQARGGLGDCSTVCFPTPTGRTCGCQKGISLKPDGRACSDIYQCTNVIQQKVTLSSNKTSTIDVTFEPSCLRYLDDKCMFKCPQSYVPIDSTPLVCTKTGWNKELSSTPLCREKRCPQTIKNGQLANTCGREIGEKCEYTCNKGFTKTRKYAVCTSDETYHLPDEELCEPAKCTEVISNGKLGGNCDRSIDSTCDYTCNKFYTPSDKKSQVKCTTTGWAPSLMCTESVCDDASLSNGMVATSCKKQIGGACMYKCNKGFVNTTYMTVCKSDRKWHPSDSCKVAKCPSLIPNGVIQQPCNFAIYSTCDFVCDKGFKASASHPNLTCGAIGQWAIQPKDRVCLETVTISGAQKQKQDGGLPAPGVAAGFVVLVLIVVALVVLIVFLYRRNMAKSGSPYATASFHNGASGIAIENPGYLQTSEPRAHQKDDNPYSTADPSQMQPVTFATGTEAPADDGISNPLYDKEPLPELGHVEMDQDKTVLTYESWRKEREQTNGKY